MIRRVGAAAIFGVLSKGYRRFAGTAPSIPASAMVYELSKGVFEAERTDSGEVIIYENDQ